MKYNILSIIWRYKFQALSLVLGLWLFLSFSCPGPIPLQHGQSSIAIQEKIVEKIKTEYVDRPVIKLVPSPAQVEKIEAKLGAPLPLDLLAIFKIPILPDGGTIIPFLDPEGKVQAEIYPNKPKRFQILKDPYAEVEYSFLNRGIDVGAGFDGIRIGRTKIGVKGGVQQETNLEGLRVYLKGRVRVEF